MQSKLFKRKWVIILCLIAIAIASCALAACTYEPYDPLKDGYTATVIYDANGGQYSGSNTSGLRTFRYKPGVTIIEPGTGNGGVEAPTLASNHITGWYQATLDENNQPLKNADNEFVDENGASIFEGQEWDFTQALPEEENTFTYLVADWALNYSLTVEVGEEAKAAGIENYVDQNYDEPGPVTIPDVGFIRWRNHTVRYFHLGDHKPLLTDEDWAQLVLSDENPHITVYAEWLDGDWEVINFASQLSNIRRNANYFLDSDIDMEGQSLDLDVYSGEFNGNGHTISNVVVEKSINALVSSDDIGMFTFSQFGSIHDITFENCRFEVSLDRRANNDNGIFNIGLLGGTAEDLELDEFTGIAFVGCSIAITRQGQGANSEVNVGEGSYYGIFGELEAGQTFTPAQGSQRVTVTLDGADYS